MSAGIIWDIPGQHAYKLNENANFIMQTEIACKKLYVKDPCFWMDLLDKTQLCAAMIFLKIWSPKNTWNKSNKLANFQILNKDYHKIKVHTTKTLFNIYF